MKRFAGMMPKGEIEEERRYVNGKGETWTVQAGPRGWSVLCHADQSAEWKDCEKPTRENFSDALANLRSRHEVTELVGGPGTEKPELDLRVQAKRMRRDVDEFTALELILLGLTRSPDGMQLPDIVDRTKARYSVCCRALDALEEEGLVRVIRKRKEPVAGDENPVAWTSAVPDEEEITEVKDKGPNQPAGLAGC
jgi:hypothetical protein